MSHAVGPGGSEPGQNDFSAGVGAVAFLIGAGYCPMDDFTFRRPSAEHVETAEEARAIAFLTDRWAFGGLAPTGAPTGANA